MYKVVFYCPDLNTKFKHNLSNAQDLGEREIAIIKMASALSNLGNRVSLYAYCDAGIYDGIEYRDFREVNRINCDIFIATPNLKYDLSEIADIDIQAKIKIVWLTGARYVRGIEPDIFDYDFYYATSVFLKERAVKEWTIPFKKTFTTYFGFDPDNFSVIDEGVIKRNKYGFIFGSHPSRGLFRVVEILERLRGDISDRLFLDIYGGYKLSLKDWSTDKGLVSQPELCRALFNYNFMLYLTDYEETSSILIQQAKRAGIIVIASDAGGNSELIQNGYDGFIIEENYRDEKCYEKVRGLISHLLNDEGYANYIRENAKRHSLTWGKVARDWINHWDEILNKDTRKRVVISSYYSGYKNLGDEAILNGIIKDIKSIDSNSEITVVSGDPFSTEKIHKVRALPRDDFKLQTKEVEKADIVILSGGGVFQDYDTIKTSQFFDDHRNGVTAYANVPLMAKIYQKPLIYYAQGVGPLFSKESFQFCRWVFEIADLISVRDGYSYNILTELLDIDPSKVKLSYDPVLKSAIPPKERAQALLIFNNIPLTKRIVCVSIRYWINKFIESKLIEELGLALKRFLSENDDYHIVFIPFQRSNKGEYDITVCKAVSRYLPKNSFTLMQDYTNHEELLAFYSIAEFSIGMRYHSLILSAVANVPFIALSYDKKDDEFMKELGLDGSCIDIKNITADEVLRKIDYLRNNRAPLKTQLTETISRILTNRIDSICMLKERKINLEPFEMTLMERDIDTELHSQLKEREREIKQLSLQVLSLQNQMKESLKERDNLLTQLTQIKAERNNLDISLNMILNSNFWKVANLYYKVRDRIIILRGIHRFLEWLKNKKRI